MKYFFATILCAVLSSGCIPIKPEADEEAVENVQNTQNESALIDELITILNDPAANRSNVRPYQIAAELTASSPTSLTAAIDLVGSATTGDQTKIFVLQVVNPYMTQAYLPFIKSLLDSHDPVTRSCATSLLGPIPTQNVIELLSQLREDANPAVAFSAWSGLALQAQEPHRNEFIQFYKSPESSKAQRSEIIRVILFNPQLEDLPTLSMAVKSKDIEAGTRRIIATALGDLGTIQCVESLNDSIKFESANDYRILVESAIALINERNKA